MISGTYRSGILSSIGGGRGSSEIWEDGPPVLTGKIPSVPSFVTHMTEISQTGKKAKQQLSACPICSIELWQRPIGRRPPYTRCPHCETELLPVWWQRVLIVLVDLILGFALPASLGIQGLDLLIVGSACCFPGLLLAIFLVFTTIHPKYVPKRPIVMTLLPK